MYEAPEKAEPWPRCSYGSFLDPSQGEARQTRCRRASSRAACSRCRRGDVAGSPRWLGAGKLAPARPPAHPRDLASGVVPLLAEGWTVVCPDLRGDGQLHRSRPPLPPDQPYSKRAMARDCAPSRERSATAATPWWVMIGAPTSLTGWRWDDTEAVTHLGFLGGVPIGEALLRADARFASAWWHWFFLGQTEKPAERNHSSRPR